MIPMIKEMLLGLLVFLVLLFIFIVILIIRKRKGPKTAKPGEEKAPVEQAQPKKTEEEKVQAPETGPTDAKSIKNLITSGVVKEAKELQPDVSEDDDIVFIEDFDEEDGRKVEATSLLEPFPEKKAPEPEPEAKPPAPEKIKAQEPEAKPPAPEKKEEPAPEKPDKEVAAVSEKSVNISDITESPESFHGKAITVKGNLKLSSEGNGDFWYLLFDDSGSAVVRSTSEIPYEKCTLKAKVEKTNMGQTYLEVQQFDKL